MIYAVFDKFYKVSGVSVPINTNPHFNDFFPDKPKFDTLSWLCTQLELFVVSGIQIVLSSTAGYCRLRAWNRTPCTATSCLKRLVFVWFLAADLDRRKEHIIFGQRSCLFCRLRSSFLRAKMYKEN